MPLYAHAIELIRANLEALQRGERVKTVSIGTLTPSQLTAINSNRITHNAALPPVCAEVVFLGGHVYRSRIVGDGYSIDDVIDQIVSAMDEASQLVGNLPMQAVENPTVRLDRYGNQVHDRAILSA